MSSHTLQGHVRTIFDDHWAKESTPISLGGGGGDSRIHILHLYNAECAVFYMAPSQHALCDWFRNRGAQALGPKVPQPSSVSIEPVSGRFTRTNLCWVMVNPFLCLWWSHCAQRMMPFAIIASCTILPLLWLEERELNLKLICSSLAKHFWVCWDWVQPFLYSKTMG